MTDASLLRWIFLFVFVGLFLISGYYRRRARQSGEAIARQSEGGFFLLVRMLVAAPLYLSYLAYIVNPRWMGWASFEVPLWLRWLAAVVGVGMLPLLIWVMTSIGKNISETILTKESHQLVSHGPYRWIRHPLYAVAGGALISLSIVAANWFMLAMALISLIAISAFVIPKEEQQLIRKFGDEYRQYQKRSGKLTPRILRRD